VRLDILSALICTEFARRTSMNALVRSIVTCSAFALASMALVELGSRTSVASAEQSPSSAPAAQNPPTKPPESKPASTTPAQSGTTTPASTTTQTPATQPQSSTTPAKTDAGPAEARSAAQTAPGDKDKPVSAFSKEQIEQMVAPIALYPDGLLVQILMASTYPLEVVEAQRWVEKNPSLKGKALEDALTKQTWDASVKSMCGFPDIVKRMSSNLDWMQDLGDAFLGQKKEVLDTCQRLRKIAYDAGTLKTTEQQKVVVEEDKSIVIQSSNPEVVYVPTYSPQVVYVGWSYPTYYYPPMYPAYPPGYGAMAFTAGVFWGAAIWGGCNWGHGDVNINVDRQNNFNHIEHNSGDRGNRGNQNWQHNPEHRQGVNYRDSKTAQQFGGQAGSSRVSRDAARGYSGSKGPGASQLPAGSGNRGGGPSASQRPASGGAGASQRPSGGASASQRPANSSSRPSSGSASSRAGSSSGALSGSSSAGLDRAASQRGAASRGTSSLGGSSSGGARSSGGGGRGGGGRGGGGRR
jgi:hypothetical protein